MDKVDIDKTKKQQMINVTKPFLPPMEEYTRLLEGIWERNWLTNNGPLVIDLESKLKEYLKVDNLLFLNNGTIALQLAIKALNLKGEIITTPFSFVATSSSILWEGCTPVFVDIDQNTFNIDSYKIEEAITEHTSAILATHVYGNPCNIDHLESVAKKHNLKIIFDAAHCFGTEYKSKSVFYYGDVSTTSFHATKLFHTIEGGAVFTNDTAVLKRLEFMRNFGFFGPENFAEVGINGKNSEFHAAMGIVNLRYIDQLLESRKMLSEYYDLKLKGLCLIKQVISPETKYNFSYYPVLLPSEASLKIVMKDLENEKIFTRRYFYPLLSDFFSAKKVDLPVSEHVSRRVLCLPIFEGLTNNEIDQIADVIAKSLKKSK